MPDIDEQQDKSHAFFILCCSPGVWRLGRAQFVFAMNEKSKRLLGYALSGWGIAYLGAMLFLGDTDFGDTRLLLFLSLAPGVITGLIVAHIVNKNNEPSKIEQTKTPEERLIDLENLLEKGVLSQEEFEEQKKKILNS